MNTTHLIIRSVGQIPVFDVSVGTITGNGFVPCSDISAFIDEHELGFFRESVSVDNLLGTQAFISNDNLGAFLCDLFEACLVEDVSFYPGIIDITLNVDDNGQA